MGRWRLATVLGPALVVSSPAVLGAQVGDCDFLPVGNDVVTVMGDVTHIIRPRLSCADGMRISADSLRHYGSANLFDLWGQVSFEDAEIRLQSSNGAQYFEAEKRLTATEAARLERKSDGSSVTGESLELLQQTASRPQQQLTATGGRPHAILYPERREAAPADTLPFEVDADRILLRGTEMDATGSVGSAANTVEYRAQPGQLVLRGSASLLMDGRHLTGGLLLLQMPDGEVSEVTAREGGSLVSERYTFVAPLIWFVLSGGELERLVGARDFAWTPPDSVKVEQPVAFAEDFSMRGDSIDVTALGGALDEVLATGNARAEAMSSDLVVPEGTPPIARRDWIEGDTIEARFIPIEADSAGAPPTPASDTTDTAQPDVRLERLFAHMGARAFYRMEADTTRAARDTTAAAPDSAANGTEPKCLAFHYVTGDSIVISFAEGRVVSTEVKGQVKGQHWEPPAGCRAGPPADSSAVRPPVLAPAAPSPDTLSPAAPASGTPPPAAPSPATPPRPKNPAQAKLSASRTTIRSFTRSARQAGRSFAAGRP
jgi:hypothetical protein